MTQPQQQSKQEREAWSIEGIHTLEELLQGSARVKRLREQDQIQLVMLAIRLFTRLAALEVKR